MKRGVATRIGLRLATAMSVFAVTALSPAAESVISGHSVSYIGDFAGAAWAQSEQAGDRAEELRNRLGIGEPGDAGPATLEADIVEYDPATEIVRARGNVEVFYEGRVLRADEIIYNARTDEIEARGNIRLVNVDGSVMAADQAAFDSALQNGLIRGAKLVLSDGQTRIAAVEARRVDGRYASLSKAVYSPCETCKDAPSPLWRIRARKVVQDDVSRDIIYEDATFEFFGVPIGYLPYFRHADPSVKRRTGFLAPSYNSSHTIGHYLKTPFFWDISGNRDLTITPYLGLGEVFPSGELELRGLETFGRYRIGGSLAHSRDKFETGFRGHLDADAEFDLGSNIEAGFDAFIATDDTYLRRYEFSSVDRTDARAYVQRFHESGFASIESVYFQSFRKGEFAGDIPFVAPHVDFEEVFDAPALAGQIVVSGDGLYLRRRGGNGRDTGRISGTVAWRGDYVSREGIVFEAIASVRGDLYHVENDGTISDGQSGRVLPLAGLTTSYPLAKYTDSATHVIEPIASLVYAPYGGNPDDIPNEDSLSFELDELNIFDIDRFSGLDRWEDGPRAAIGARYQMLSDDGGPDLRIELAQSFRLRENDLFSEESGLDDVASDLVGGWDIALFDQRFRAGQRFRLDDEFKFARNEAYADVVLFDRLALGASYSMLEPDPSFGASTKREEITARMKLEVTDYWSVSANTRFDVERDRGVSAAGGLNYADECFELGFTVAHRFNKIDGASRGTTFNLAVKLKTLGTE